LTQGATGPGSDGHKHAEPECAAFNHLQLLLLPAVLLLLVLPLLLLYHVVLLVQ
jgi:hypothetical protein